MLKWCYSIFDFGPALFVQPGSVCTLDREVAVTAYDGRSDNRVSISFNLLLRYIRNEFSLFVAVVARYWSLPEFSVVADRGLEACSLTWRQPCDVPFSTGKATGKFKSFIAASILFTFI